MTRSLCISLILLISCATSCRVKMTRDLSPVHSEVDLIKNPYFTSSVDDYVYKMSLQAYGKNMGGVLVIKNLGVEHYRLALMTEFGSTLVDMELLDGTFTVHTVSDELDKKVILNTLKNDFALLLTQNYVPIKVFAQEDGVLYQASVNKKTNLLRFDSKGQLFEIIQTGLVKEKVFITFLEAEEGVARKILIDHANRKVSFELKKLQ